MAEKNLPEEQSVTPVGCWEEYYARYPVRQMAITGMLRSLLVNHFGDSNNIISPSLKDLLWTNDQTTKILIEDKDEWNQTKSNRRPSILIAEGGYQSLRIAVGDAGELDGQFDRTYEKMAVGSHSLLCISVIPGGASMLSNEVFEVVDSRAPEIRANYDLRRFDTISVGQRSRIREAKDYFIVPIQIGWAYSWQWVLKGQDRVLRRVEINQKVRF